jgi:hypothetical protein
MVSNLLKNEVSNATTLERARWLKVLKLEEYAASCSEREYA